MYTPSHPHSVYCLFVNFTPNSDGLQLVSTAPTAKHKQIMRCHQWWGELGQSRTEHPKTSPLSATSRPLFSSILSSYKLSSSTKHESQRISWPWIQWSWCSPYYPRSHQGWKNHWKSRYVPVCPRTRWHPHTHYGIIRYMFVWLRHQQHLWSSTYSISC